jgi:hypothetical protein
VNEPFVPRGPLDKEPIGPATVEERDAALMNTLRGVNLGAYDTRMIRWMNRFFDNPTLRCWASLLERARMAGMLDAISLQEHMERRGNQGHHTRRRGERR